MLGSKLNNTKMVGLRVATNQNGVIAPDNCSILLDKLFINALSKGETSAKVIFMRFVCLVDTFCSGYTSS